MQNNGRNCPIFPDGFCGSGVMLPLGTATDSILFSGGCGGTCDLRTVSVAGGSVFMDETFSDGSCPGSCHPTPSEPASGTLTDAVVGGTGIFAGATATLTGSVTSAAAANNIKLAGTITLQT